MVACHSPFLRGVIYLLMAVKKLKKEEPRNKAQQQYEREMKHDFYSMLVNMNKTLIAQYVNFTNDTDNATGTAVDANH